MSSTYEYQEVLTVLHIISEGNWQPTTETDLSVALSPKIIFMMEHRDLHIASINSQLPMPISSPEFLLFYRTTILHSLLSFLV